MKGGKANCNERHRHEKLQAVLNDSEGYPTIFCIKAKMGGKKDKNHHYAW